MSECDTLCMYGFRALYPSNWKIELDPESERSKGNVAFKSPDKERIFISWGQLEEVKKIFPSVDDFVKDSINRIKTKQGVKTAELIQTRSLQINSHEAEFIHLKAIISSGRSLTSALRTKIIEQEMRSLSLYCGDSERYFVIFETTTPEKSSEHSGIFEDIIQSFTCH